MHFQLTARESETQKTSQQKATKSYINQTVDKMNNKPEELSPQESRNRKIHSFVHSFIHSYVHSFIRSFIRYSFISSFVN